MGVKQTKKENKQNYHIKSNEYTLQNWNLKKSIKIIRITL